MLTLIKNADIYAPEALGPGFLLLGGGKILRMGAGAPDIAESCVDAILDMNDAPVGPGLIDCHVHLTGGGGEDGFATQAPPVPLSRFTRFGVTSMVGLLGTDDETRSTANLIARTRALREEGLSAWCWTGGYHVPPTTLTGSVRSDIVNIDCIIGLGELAISDHRSSQPTFDELARLASEAHVAGLLSKKAGVLHLHLGDGGRGLELVSRLLDETELPPRVFHPTHVNRRKQLFEEACALSHRNVVVDVTAFPVEEGENAWCAADAWERFHEAACPPAHLTISSDGGGCLPHFDDNGELVKMGFATSAGLPETIRELARRGHRLDRVLPAMTSNVARALRLPGKGTIAPGFDADLIFFNEDHQVRHVMAGGKWMVQDGSPAVKGTFED
ncbi:MAG: beta-aspartyl-peptidase [Xanthomonadales bacterium]|nr:beta-aspartyl-peptidase [Gammaproteobacteria bacterium]MBT8053545.1 beta-aspartyl-peptidase [Gammaproteobacteria bacterium]NND57974.1 beta-aspartyl-peptidase [Xanthomonadales bacterium]NNK50860.1 beta-aspartyl-peptidase [Xanthomonadales bacterium]